jgi:rhodanese-related sulfurtransferase
MKKIIVSVICVMIISGSIFSQGVKEISPQEAYDLAKKAGVYLIDVRTIAEYVYVGHPENAYCLPILFWDERELVQVRNESFLQDLTSKFKKEDTLVFICRSGNRSPVTARMAVAAGFQEVFNVPEGFEGKKDEKGYRTVNGGKNRGLPFTYKLEAKYLYR